MIVPWIWGYSVNIRVWCVSSPDWIFYLILFIPSVCYCSQCSIWMFPATFRKQQDLQSQCEVSDKTLICCRGEVKSYKGNCAHKQRCPGTMEERGESTNVVATVGFHLHPQQDVRGAVIAVSSHKPTGHCCFLHLCSMKPFIKSQGESYRAQCCTDRPQVERG